MFGKIVLIAAALVGCVSSAAAAQQSSSVVTYHDGESRVGNFTVPGLTWEKARGLHLDSSFQAHVDGHLYAQPLYWHDPGSGAAMLVAATEDDVIQAFDAASGKELWRRTLGKPVAGSALPCGNINPLGITGTPVIDPATGAIYVDAMVAGDKGPRHLVFGLSLKDGSILQGWPVDVADALQRQGKAFNPREQNQRSALTLLNDTLYVAFSGHYGDCGDYHGWIVGLPLKNPGNVLSFESRARGGGIWAPGGLATVGGDLFFATGNTFGAHTWSDGEAVFRVGPDLRRSNNNRDFFTPRDWQAMDQRDEDLGGTNPIPLDVPAAKGTQALLLALGKDRKAYLLDRNALGGIGGELTSDTVSEIPIRTAPAAFPVGDSIFVAFQGGGTHCPAGGRNNGLTVLKITGGSPPAMTTAWCGALRGAGSASVTTTDGRANPIVWITGAEGDNRLHGFKGDTGEPIFTGGTAAEAMTGLRHFGTLIAADGRLFVGADDRIYAFSF